MTMQCLIICLFWIYVYVMLLFAIFWFNCYFTWFNFDSIRLIFRKQIHIFIFSKKHIFQDVSHGVFTKGKRVLPLMTARGCPQTCTFCCRLMGFDLRERSVENVMEEISFNVEKYKIDELYFEDDDFTNNRSRPWKFLKRFAMPA